MNAKTLLTLVGRKNATLAAGVMIGLLLAVQYPELVAEIKEYVGSLGLGAGGAISLAVSIWLTVNREKAHKAEVNEALLTPVPEVTRP